MSVKPLEKGTPRTILRENALPIAMYGLGTLLIDLRSWPLGLFYLAYSLASNVVCMAWVCPYCGHDGLGTCAAGFDLLSSRRFQPVLGRSFGQEFRRKSWVLYPGWFLPPLVGLFLMITAFSRFAPALLVVFCVDAFWLLLQFSKSHCETCETVDCPRYPKSRKVVQAD